MADLIGGHIAFTITRLGRLASDWIAHGVEDVTLRRGHVQEVDRSILCYLINTHEDFLDSGEKGSPSHPVTRRTHTFSL